VPKATITKAEIGRVLDAAIARQGQFGCREIKPDGTILIHPKQTNIIDKPSVYPRLKEWKG